MSSRTLTHGAPALLLLSLTTNAIFVSCAADSVTTPPMQDGNAAILAELSSISDRIDSIDARTRRIDDATMMAVDSIVAALSDPEATFLENLASAIELSADIRAQICAELGGTLGGEFEVGPNAEGGAHGEIGPNVVEAEAQAKAQARLKTELKLKFGLDGALKGSICAGAGASLGGDLPAVADAMRTAMSSLGIDGTSMTTMINQVRGPSTANYANTVDAVRSALPLPNSLSTLVDNPINLLAGSPQLTRFADDVRCNPGFFPAGTEFVDIQSRLCGLQVPSAETYVAILNGLDGLPSTVSALQTRLGTVCSGVNALIPQRISISSYSLNILGQTYTVFPGYSARLFPGATSLTC